jgi:hypothetical protein
MKKSLEERLNPQAKGKQTPRADFDRNRDGVYGGLPKACDSAAPGPHPDQPPRYPARSSRNAPERRPRMSGGE